MQVEYRVNSGHFGMSSEDPAFPEAVNKYTSLLWPFGRYERAKDKLEEKREELLNKHGLEVEGALGAPKIVVDGVEDEEEAKSRMNQFKKDIEEFYREEFDVNEPFEFIRKNGRF